MTVELPKDAEGREIPLDTVVLYDSCGTKVSVKEFLFRTLVESQKTEWTIEAQYEGNMYYNSFRPKDAWHSARQIYTGRLAYENPAWSRRPNRPADNHSHLRQMRRRVAVRHHVRELPILRDGD